MEIRDDEIRELGALYGTVKSAVESGVTYFLIPGLILPAGCSPAVTDALLCPSPRDGYNSRLTSRYPSRQVPATIGMPATFESWSETGLLFPGGCQRGYALLKW